MHLSGLGLAEGAGLFSLVLVPYVVYGLATAPRRHLTKEKLLFTVTLGGLLVALLSFAEQPPRYELGDPLMVAGVLAPLQTQDLSPKSIDYYLMGEGNLKRERRNPFALPRDLQGLQPPSSGGPRPLPRPPQPNENLPPPPPLPPPKPPPVTVENPGPRQPQPYELPVELVGIVQVHDERLLMLRTKDDQTVELRVGQQVPGYDVRLVQLRAEDAIVENDKGERFILLGLLRREQETLAGTAPAPEAAPLRPEKPKKEEKNPAETKDESPRKDGHISRQPPAEREAPGR